jgi:hypothetical protein
MTTDDRLNATTIQYWHDQITMQYRRIGELEAKMGTENLKPKVKERFEALEARVKAVEQKMLKSISNKRYKIKLKQKRPWLVRVPSMRARCNNPKHLRYKYYGGKGIKALITHKEIEHVWFRDKAYLMREASLDRIDNDGDYAPYNVRCVTPKQNAQNKVRKYCGTR